MQPYHAHISVNTWCLNKCKVKRNFNTVSESVKCKLHFEDCLKLKLLTPEKGIFGGYWVEIQLHAKLIFIVTDGSLCRDKTQILNISFNCYCLCAQGLIVGKMPFSDHKNKKKI